MNEYTYQERPKRCEARLVTADNLEDVATWCGGTVREGRVMYPVNDVLFPASPGRYLVLRGGQFVDETAEQFERGWAPAEGE